MGNATALAVLGRFVITGALALATGCAIQPAASPTPPPTNTPSPASSSAACTITVTDDDIGAGQLFEGTGFAADVGVTMTFGGPDGQTLTEENFPDLRTDARGVFATHLFAERANIGQTLLEVTDGRCTASTQVTVLAENFPGAACDVVDELPPSGGGAIDDYAVTVLADEPVAYYRFEEAGGRTVSDAAGGESGELVVDATVGQPGFIEGSRSVLMSDGGDHVSVPAVELDGDFTMEAWLRVCGENIAARDAIFGQAGEGPDLSMAVWRAHLWTGDFDALEASVVVSRSDWMHFVVTREGDALTMFQQGELVSTGEWDGVFTISALGAGNVTGRGTLEGWLDEIAIYDHALSAERVAEHFDFAP